MNGNNIGNITRKAQRMITKPISFLFSLWQSKTRVEIWLFENSDIRYEAKIIGFDEYMNMVLDDCEEVNEKKEVRNYLGRLMLKGDNISLVRGL